MKKSKLTLGLVSAIVSMGALAACNEVTASDGNVLEFTDAQGTVTRFTAEELFGEQYSTSVASTDFDNVYEVLIRKYYESGGGKTSLPELKELAQKDVQDIKQQAEKNANSNNTSYAEEFSKLLSSNNCDNVEELYQAKLYQEEKSKFESDYQTDEMIEKMRDGDGVYTASEDFGIGSDGYLVEQMPYTISHILVKLNSASNGEHAQATISQDESYKLGQVVKLLAGAKILDESGKTSDGKTAANTRTSFGMIAKQNSEDSGSAAKFGQLDVMDRDVADSFINEFKFGIYAYEAIFNQVNQDETLNPYAAKATRHANSGETYKLTDKIKFSENATYTDKAKAKAADGSENALAEGEHLIANFFKDNSTIGRIPYGAAVALASDAVAKNDFLEAGTTKKMNWTVNGGASTFFPRNIIFNKYFNNHRVAVIVPNEIPFNDSTISLFGDAADYRTENFIGKVDAAYAALPGFSKDTKSILPASVLGQDTNVLTNEKNQIILAVRGGASGNYEGIHFMVIDRSALEEIVTFAEDGSSTRVDMTLAEYEASALKTTTNSNSLSEFYTIYKPGETAFPTYGGEDKTTYVNQLRTSDQNYKENSEAIRGKIKSYNSNKETYMFQSLMEDGNLNFANNAVAKTAETLITNWIQSKRAKAKIDNANSFDETWAKYIEYLTAQDEARALNEDGSQYLISETCAVGYNTKDSDPNSLSGVWTTGGACYAK